MMKKPISRPAGRLGDVRGGVRLAVDGTRHITGLVEALHGQIQRVAPPLRRRTAGGIGSATATPNAHNPDGLPGTRGLTGLVYRSIQGTTRLVGRGLDGALAALDPLLTGLPAESASNTPRRDVLVAALNGVLGDHLAHSGNPLAIDRKSVV